MLSYKRIYIFEEILYIISLKYCIFKSIEINANKKKRDNHLPLFNVYTNQNLAQSSISMSLSQKSSILA
jgi:hypothetical protein